MADSRADLARTMADIRKREQAARIAGLLTRDGSPDTLTAYQPTRREKLAATLAGDAKPGSLRQQLVADLIGGIDGNETGLIDFTPFSALFADESARRVATPGQRGQGAAELALSVIPIPAAKAGGKAVAKAVERGAERAVEKRAPIVAYHGSPHKFDQFDTAHIGKGEGAQAYGHGLYFAENEDVAKAYRDALAHGDDIYVGGRKLRRDLPFHEDTARNHVMASARDEDPIAGAISRAEEYAQYMRGPRGGRMAAESADRTINVLRDWQARGVKVRNAGAMYQVGIHADPESFLDWDAPLNQQPRYVRERIAPIVGDPQLAQPNPFVDEGTVDFNALGGGRPPFDPRTGQTAYRQLGNKPEAADALSEAGIPGIKYLDQGSRGAGTGTRNYVVFNAKVVEIMKRYGVPLAVAIPMANAELGREAK